MLKRFSTHAAIVLLYVSFGLSLGCYYTATYFGRSGWPLPSCEAISGVLLYYFSVIYTTTEVQAAHWISVFVASGYLWIASLWFVSNRVSCTSALRANPERFSTAHDRFTGLGLAVAIATIPLSLPLPFMIWWMGGGSRGFHWSRFIAMCLRHAWVTPPTWLNYIYFGLAAAAFVAQVAIVRRQFPVIRKRSFMTFAVAFGMLLLVSIASGLLLSFILPAVFEQ